MADRDDERVRLAVQEACGLPYGAYEGVALESATGTQFFSGKAGSILGADHEPVEMPVRTLTFSVPREPEILASAIEAIRETHSYQEPVINILEGMATRAHYGKDEDNPNRWWNRGYAK